MNIPNALTISRLLFLPFIILFSYQEGAYLYAALFLVILALISDILDGWVARTFKQTTEFGKFFDQAIDKLMVLLLLIVMIDLDILPLWIGILLIARDQVTFALRVYIKGKEKILKSEISGKIKFGLQVGVIFLGILTKIIEIKTFFFWFAVVTVIQSYIALIEFLYKNKKEWKSLMSS